MWKGASSRREILCLVWDPGGDPERSVPCLPENLVEKFQEVAKDASVKRIVVKNEAGQTVLSVPVTWGAFGAVATLALSPWLAALGVIAAVASRCTIEVDKVPTITA